MKLFVAILFAASAIGAPAAFASSDFEAMCLDVSAQWGTAGDVAGQCSCLADKAAADASVDSELRSLAEEYDNDADAYEAASGGTKAALDACSVNN